MLLAILMVVSGRALETFIAVPLAWITIFVALLLGLWLAALLVGKWWLMEPRSRWREAVAAVVALIAGFFLFGALGVLAGAIGYQ